MKTADLYHQIYKRDNNPTGTSGWIQWKGTDVCMDVHCACGYEGDDSHVDADFFYHYTCLGCNRMYAVGQTVTFIELTEEEKKYFD